MNLRHVNIVSQSYIGNTALLYTSKTKMGCSKPGCRSRPRACLHPKSPPAPPRRRLLAGTGVAMGLKAQKRAALDKICSGKKQRVFRRGSSREKGKDRRLPENGLALCRQAIPFPKDSRIVMVLPRTTIGKKKKPNEKPKRTKTLPPKPLKKTPT